MDGPAVDRKIFSLLDVTRSIQKTLSERYKSVFWVKAEMNKLNHYPHSGHCYPELVEKRDGKVIAQLRSNLWRDDYIRINRTFLKVLHTPLKDGITMLFCARIQFDPVHGLSLRIVDIDPVFTLGELEREKAETVATLRKEGLFDRNRTLTLPLLPRRIAVISVETSKGYADFQKVIDGHESYRVFRMLFPAVLQGERAVESIRYQLGRIRRVVSHFDVVAIIRGGGGEVGLSCFNHVDLCRDIAGFPIPVITGIGHATNETVAEMVAYRNAITPTDLANFLLSRFDAFAIPVAEAAGKIRAWSTDILRSGKTNLSGAVRYFRSVTGNVLLSHKHQLEVFSRDVIQQSRFLLQRQRELQRGCAASLKKSARSGLMANRLTLQTLTPVIKKEAAMFVRLKTSDLKNLEKSIVNMSPETVLRRGYSITRINGKAIRSANELRVGDRMITTLAEGTVISDVHAINPENS